jgi:hypothetical protein
MAELSVTKRPVRDILAGAPHLLVSVSAGMA